MKLQPLTGNARHVSDSVTRAMQIFRDHDAQERNSPKAPAAKPKQNQSSDRKPRRI